MVLVEQFDQWRNCGCGASRRLGGGARGRVWGEGYPFPPEGGLGRGLGPLARKSRKRIEYFT